MKKFFAILLTLILALSCFAALAEAVELPAEPEFDPNPEYDEYTTVEYEIEAIGAEFVCTVSRKADNSEFYLECNFYGDDQMTRTTYDGENFEVVEDLTGFMKGDTPAVLQMALDQDIWLPIEKDAPAEAVELPAEPEFDPNPEYDEYTTVEYEIEAIGAEFVCTVSRMADNSEFYLECNFYGDDQMTRTTYDGENFEVVEDLTGFMKGDTPAVLQMALDQDIWLPIEK